MRFALVVVLALTMGVSAAAAGAPPGATALCRDGTYSYSKHHSGTCSHHGGVKRSGSTGAAPAAAPAASTPAAPSFSVTGRTSGCCARRGPTGAARPAAYYSHLTKGVICAPSFRTSAIRNVPDAEKFRVEREYGMRRGRTATTIEIDHIVPLELGGSNAIANLFPEPGSGPANYHAKDALENRAKAAVCEGRLTLRAARRGIARDWEALYRRLFGHAPA